MKAIFHPDALMSGYMMGEYMMGSPEPFFQVVKEHPSPSESGTVYTAEISKVEVTGKVARATLKETNFMGMNFTDYFHLAKVDKKWMIISKTFDIE